MLQAGLIMVAIVVGIVITLMICWLVSGIIEHKKTKLPFSCCLGFHKPSGKATFDGASLHCTCERCKKDLMQDSQGNWF